MNPIVSLFMFSCGDYEKVKQDVWEENWKAMRLYSVVALVAFGVITLVSVFSLSIGKFKWVYLVYTFLSLVYFCISRCQLRSFLGKKLVVYSFFAALLLFGIITGTLITPEEFTANYIVFMVAAPLLFTAMVIGSVLAGAIWAFVPAWFKSRWNTNETLFTLMMNYVATSIVACMTNIMRGQASSLGTLNKATKAGWLPVINGQRYTINIIVVLVLTFAMYAYLKYSKQGYEISVVGESENTARYAGINVSRVMIRTMLLSGAICGLCGFLVVAGKDQTISTTSAGGNGFTAIIVAWLAKFNTFYMMLISFLLIFLDRGASEIASAYSLNEYAADIITGIILFFILGSEFFINYRLVWRGHHDGKEGK